MDKIYRNSVVSAALLIKDNLEDNDILIPQTQYS